MPELGPEVRDLLVEYVDEQTPREAPPFAGVERVVRRRKRRRNQLAVAAMVVLVAGIALIGSNLPQAEEPAAPTETPTVSVLDDGPPPAQFKFGTTLLILQKEIRVSAVRPSPDSPSVLVVETVRDEAAGETCLPHTVVRILSQDAATVRIAAYRYSVAPDQPETQECFKPQGGPLRIQLDLRSSLAGRTVLAGSTGDRVVLN
ncbi:hypothetical protein EV643_105245 [Kribbella sp. VKM Ac-2527]|uniref:Uncharacterized protein n=1 Tax=Kribbella caucasensis TaxID=2512215 RepID=A0A4R6KLK5_9ACTN|nr:hypothetical protein [Kribbella sp. VKM Ac-2527]TDO50015.1 hypothetical protein EV643_105245 [Kribbella sp. VKM Ac-2527]